ncbi:MAG: elongation factor P [Dehalococcoidales bacterium]|nr:elongation factor P [Dehalococcoidales bacterium]
MISGSELRKGVIIEHEGKLWQVLEYHHVKMKRTALARVKMRDLEGGHTVEQSFQSDAKFSRVRLEVRPMQYLYNDGDLYYLMDEETFEQMPVTTEQLGDKVYFLKENMVLQVATYKEKLIDVELPITVDLEVTDTQPGFKGDTVTAGTKPATLETGIVVNVPMFVDIGDKIKVDTRDGSYLERA